MCPAGYSGTPLLKKLGLKADSRVVFVGDPPHFQALLGPLPDGVTLLSRPGKGMDFVHGFVRSRAELERKVPRWRDALARDGVLWVSWPKKTSPLAGDVGGADVREVGLAAGLVDVKVCAVDDDWSGHKFCYRRKDR